ncbi:MAG: hypothetical protein ABIA93_00695 [Candidatus Woesearchaeota archaeon]
MPFSGNESAWETLSAISESPRTITQLAVRLKKSLPYTLTITNLLKAHGLITEDVEKRSKPGKPAKVLRITKGAASIKAVMPGFGVSKDFTPSAMQCFLLTLATLKPQTAGMLSNYIFSNPELLDKCETIKLVKESPKIELFLVTDDVDSIRKKYSTGKAFFAGTNMDVVCWTHSRFELDEGMGRNDQHFMLLDKGQTIYLNR